MKHIGGESSGDLLRFKAYFDASSSGIFVYGEDGSLLDINAAGCRMHGFSREEMLAMDPREFIAAETHHVFDAFREAVSRGERFHGEALGIRKDGSTFDAEIEGELIDVNGAQLLFSSVIDVSQRNALAEQLRHAQRMEALGQLAGGVAHDFNNLLLVIMGYSELIAARVQDQDVREDLEAVASAGERARELVQRLLAFSRRQSLAVEATDLNTFVDDQVRTLRRVLPESISIDVLRFEGEPIVRLDRGQFEQVLMNLAINASHAMPTGGRLSFELSTTYLDGDDAERHREAAHGPYVLLTVSDTGTGMDEPTQARIFEPFFSTKERGEGTGLGLAMAYGIVKQHGGHITVYSELAHGTCFKVYLPAAKEKAMQKRPSENETTAGGSERVLVVEDNRPLRELTSRVLTELGYDVTTAPNDKRAFDVAETMSQLDLLLTDVVLPGRNGRQVFEGLRDRFPTLRVLYMSGYTENVVSHHGMLDDSANLLAKPFGMSELANAVRQALDTSSS